jgi:hypothetical protein
VALLLTAVAKSIAARARDRRRGFRGRRPTSRRRGPGTRTPGLSWLGIGRTASAGRRPKQWPITRTSANGTERRWSTATGRRSASSRTSTSTSRPTSRCSARPADDRHSAASILTWSVVRETEVRLGRDGALVLVIGVRCLLTMRPLAAGVEALAVGEAVAVERAGETGDRGATRVARSAVRGGTRSRLCWVSA